MSMHQFKVKARNGSEVSLSDYKGKVVLVVNTATGCGFTPQYQELQAIYEEYNAKGFEILDFPCNQFREQAPGTDEEIHAFCVGRFGIKFPQFSKIEVNGENADPLYKWLRENTVFEGFDDSPAGIRIGGIVESIDPTWKTHSAIKWNFTKFLIDKDGNIVKRFEPMISLDKVREGIESLL